MSLKLSKTKAYNPSTKKQGFRTTVKSNGKADMESLIVSASNNTTMHKGEMQLAFTLILDAIKEALVSGKTVERKGIGNIGFTCSGAWTETAEEQKAVEHKIGVALLPQPGGTRCRGHCPDIVDQGWRGRRACRSRHRRHRAEARRWPRRIRE